MDGVFFIDKPKGMTSRDVVNFLMKKFSFRKMGHVGTLDPFATGLLIVISGKATKIGQFLESEDKVYVATLVLGEARDSEDETGTRTATAEVPPLTKSEIQRVFDSMLGRQKQIPPMYSAIKQNGVPLYRLARQGIEVERKEREIVIYSLDCLDYQDGKLTFRVHCSKGTYVRTLGVTIAEKLHTLGYLSSLRREKVGNISVQNANFLEEVQVEHLHSMLEAMCNFPTMEVPSSLVEDIKNGKRIALSCQEEKVLLVYQNTPLAVYEKEDEKYRCVRGLWS